MLLYSNGEGISPNSTIIWAPPSHGNIGQLSIDNAVESIQQLRLIGSLESSYLMPMTGYHKLNGEVTLCKPFEVFKYTNTSTNSNVYALQQRSPCIEGKALAFCEELVSFLSSNEIACQQLIIVTGANMIDLPDEAIKDRFFQLSSGIAVTSSPTSIQDKLVQITHKLPAMNYRLLDHASTMNNNAVDILYDVDAVPNSSSNSQVTKYPHGMFYARKVYESFPHTVCIGRYCNEGHSNVLDGKLLGNIVKDIIQV